MARVLDRAAIAAKRAHVQEQLDALLGGERIVKRVGGATIAGMGGNVDLQRARLAELEWLLRAPDVAAVEARLAGHMAQLGEFGPEILEAPHALGLPPEVLLEKALGELCQLALGDHRAQRAARALADPDGGGE